MRAVRVDAPAIFSRTSVRSFLVARAGVVDDPSARHDQDHPAREVKRVTTEDHQVAELADFQAADSLCYPDDLSSIDRDRAAPGVHR